MWIKSVVSSKQFVLVFCNVGQGDGILIRTPKTHVILIDGGPNDAILGCISSHVPFFKRDIDVMFLSHPHEDHEVGLISVAQRYLLRYFVTENLINTTSTFKRLIEYANKTGKPRYVTKGERIRTDDGVVITVLGPSKEFLNTTSPGGVIAEKKEFASLVLLVTYGSFKAVLTGDSQVQELLSAPFLPIDVLQVPHHGSATGLSSEILRSFAPKLAVISVGKNNRYGHPNPNTLSLLKQYKLRVLRTDQNGEIVITSDGKTWEVNKN